MKNSITRIYDKWLRVPRLDDQDPENVGRDEALHTGTGHPLLSVCWPLGHFLFRGGRRAYGCWHRASRPTAG